MGILKAVKTECRTMPSIFVSKQVVELEGGRRLEIFLVDETTSTQVEVFVNGKHFESNQRANGVTIEQAKQDYGQGKTVISESNEPISK